MLLKVGMAMMAVALAFAAITAGVALRLRDAPEPAIAVKPAAKSSLEPLLRSYPPDQTQPVESEARPLAKPKPEQKPEPNPEPRPNPESRLKLESKPKAEPQMKAPPKLVPRSEPKSDPEQERLPGVEDAWAMPTDEELQAVSEPRRYELLPRAIMGLTIKAIDLYNVPVFNSYTQGAFARGVAHEPETSLPWSNTPQTNVYLAAHRLGNYGTSSRLVFFNLNKLQEGDAVVLKGRSGKTYTYRVSEVFVVDPTDVWVMGQVRGRDMLTLQTCTPIPTFEKRLIVRAGRV
jgi:sortase A